MKIYLQCNVNEIFCQIVTFRKTASDETDMGDDVEMQLPVRPRPHSNPTRLPSYASSTYTSNLRSGRSPQKAPVERKVSTPRLGTFLLVF